MKVAAKNKVILRADVRDLGRAGELVEVKPGFARNYLLPQKLAIPATEGNLKDFNKKIAAAREREGKERAAANQLADQLRGRRFVTIQRPAEGTTRLHGSVTTADIAVIIGKELGQEIDRRDVDIRQPIRALGEYQVNVKLMRGLTVPVRLLVADREPEPEVEATEETDAVAEDAGTEQTAAAGETTDETADAAE